MFFRYMNSYVSLTVFAKSKVFQIVLKVGGFPPVGGEWEILLGEIFLSGGGNLRKSVFGHSNLFQS